MAASYDIEDLSEELIEELAAAIAKTTSAVKTGAHSNYLEVFSDHAKKHPNCLTSRTVHDKISLGQWIAKQFKKNQADKLCPKRKAQLKQEVVFSRAKRHRHVI